MNSFEEKLNELKEQEKTLQFTEFNSETALRIGLSLIERAKKESKVITIDITRNSHQLFHYSFEGTSPDNDQWVIRKNRIVNRTNHSSLFMNMIRDHIGKPVEEIWYISSFDYAADGGAFPIIIKNVGVVGTITVSGLTGEEDHRMVIEAIKEYLEK